MHSADVLPPQGRVVGSAQLVPDALLTNVFQNDFLTLDGIVAGLYGTVATTSEAIFLGVDLVTVRAFPEDVVRGEADLVAETLVHLRKVFDEVQCTVA